MLARLDELLPESEYAELRRDFARWILQVLIPSRPFKLPETLQAAQSLSEVRIMLAETVQKWYAEERRAGRAEGREEGRQEGREEGRQEGRQEGQLQMLRQLLAARFGEPLPAWAESHLQRADPETLTLWATRCLTVPRLDEVFGNLDANP